MGAENRNCTLGPPYPGVVVLGGNCPRGSCPMGVIVLQGSCPWGNCPQGSCPRGSCPRGSCPRTPFECNDQQVVSNIEFYSTK